MMQIALKGLARLKSKLKIFDDEFNLILDSFDDLLHLSGLLYRCTTTAQLLVKT